MTVGSFRIIQFTTVHPRTDTRIRIKEAGTLARVWGGQVALFVQDGKGDGQDAQTGVVIRDTGPPPAGRIRRMTAGAWRMYRAVRAARPDVAHFHDPELLPWAVLLRLSGIRVIYDAHEDLPAATLSKPYIRPRLRRPLSFAVRMVEGLAARFLGTVVAATPSIATNFRSLDPVLVQNFPLLAELAPPEETVAPRQPHFAYVGGLARIRGAIQMLDALARLPSPDIRLQMAGGFPADLGAELQSMPGWAKVDFHGWADRPTVARLLASCRAGLVLFHPEPNHVKAQPNKMFEYMAAGLPVIASDFPLWREIVEGAGCGRLADPMDPDSIADAMKWILDNPEEAAAMGHRGRAAVEERFNWEVESEQLVALYRRLLDET